MRIAVNTRLLVPDKMDGIGRFTYETLKRITTNNPEHSFDFIFDRTPPIGFNFPKNVQFFSIGLPARLPILWILWFEFFLKRFINKRNYDLFLSPEGWVPGNLNCKSLGVMHDLNFEHHPENVIWSHRTYLKHYFPKFAKRSDRIATVSEYSKNDISTTYSINTSNIDVVFNGANDVFKEIDPETINTIKGKYTNGFDFFLFIGTIHPRKNLEHLLLAFDEFKKQGNTNKLLIVGNRKWWPKNLDFIYNNLKAKKDVIFLGRKEDEELANILGAATALTYIPYFEGFGIPILESFLAKTPVITSNVTSMPEISGGAAILCDPNNISQISNAMTEVSTNSNLRKDLIQKGITQAHKFSWDKTADLLWTSIQKTIAS